MRKNSIKNTRINAEVLRELSEIIRTGIKDPRIHPMTSVVSVEVTPELKFILDQSIEYGVNMSKLINEVTKDLKDKEGPDEDGEEEES